MKNEETDDEDGLVGVGGNGGLQVDELRDLCRCRCCCFCLLLPQEEMEALLDEDDTEMLPEKDMDDAAAAAAAADAADAPPFFFCFELFFLLTALVPAKVMVAVPAGTLIGLFLRQGRRRCRGYGRVAVA